MGIEPTLVAWEATVLPLNYTRAPVKFYAPDRASGKVLRLEIDLRDLELFVAVADAGSIAGAADRSHTVASAVSKRISDREDSFGCELFVRAAKGAELTPAGHALLVRALRDTWARRQLFLCTRAAAPLHSAAQSLFDHLRTQKQPS